LLTIIHSGWVIAAAVVRRQANRTRHILRLLIALPLRFAYWLWSLLRRATAWVWRELAPPVACLLAIYVGVCLTMPLPVSMWSWLALPAIAQFTSLPIAAFPLAELPSWPGLIKGLLTAIPLALRVFAMGGYKEWKESQELLGARLFYAVHVGIVWPKAWFRGVRRKAETTPASPLAP
jgi:hypothetical protein